MVARVYVEKRDGFDVEAKALEKELREILGVATLTHLRLINRYDVEGISDELFDQCIPAVFSEPQTDLVCRALPYGDDAPVKRHAQCSKHQSHQHERADNAPMAPSCCLPVSHILPSSPFGRHRVLRARRPSALRG